MSSAQHNASSPLLKLPLEVKNLIYKYTFGCNLLHIIQDPDGGAAKFKNTICCASISEEEAQENFQCENTNEWYAPANEGRHECCRFRKSTAVRDGEEAPKVLSLSPLRCCRQIYNEAHHIPYSTNTFSCADPETLRSFAIWLARGRTDGNHLAIRSLFLEMIYAESHHEDSWKTAVATCAKQLRALQDVSISIDCRSFYIFYRPMLFSNLVKDGTRFKKNVILTVLALKKLPLKTATMVIGDQAAERMKDSLLRSRMWTDSQVKYRWTLDEKRERARYVREVLLLSKR